MSIRFAAARPATVAHFATNPRRMGAFRAANDNAQAIANPELLRSALLHFASHGLSSAEAAFEQALTAQANDDPAGTANWLELCRIFDRRMADRLASGLPRP